MQKRAIILFSGGLDSTTCLAIAKSQGFQPYALSFAYGQRHEVEVEWAKRVAEQMGVVEHKILYVPLDEIKGSSLTDKQFEVPDYSTENANKIPNTYVPARNTIFLSFALAWGEVIGAYDIFIGANHIDYSNYPDCRPVFLQAFEQVAQLGTKAENEARQFKIHAPLLEMNKAKIIQTGTALGIDYGVTVSCYRANELGAACGKCESCTYRQKGFTEAQIPDPTLYI